MRTEQHRNWLLMLAEIKAPAILWGAVAVALLVTAITFLFQPIYAARTIVLLDSDLTKVLKNVDVSYPAASAGDYIRYEYFATNAVSLMQLPSLGEQLVSRLDIRNRAGERMFSEYLIQPSLIKLIYGNNGQGIKAKWISDTQQFSITGYAPDPARAVAFSREYTDLFLKENTTQFQSVLNVLLGRLDTQLRDAEAELAETDRQIIAIKNKHRLASAVDEASSLPEKIYDARAALDKARLAESVYEAKLERLLLEAKDEEGLRKTESVTVKNPMIDSLKTRIVELTGQLMAASVDYTPEHPKYQAIEVELNFSKESLRGEVAKLFGQEKESITDHYAKVAGDATDLTMAHLEFSATAAYYENLLATYTERMAELNAAQAQIEAITDRQTAIKEVVSTARQSRLAVSGVLDAPLPFFRVVSPAVIDSSNLKSYKYFPKRKQLFAIAFAGAGFLMFSFVLGRDLQVNRLYRGWQIAGLGERLEYADIPELSGEPSPDSEASRCLQDLFHAVSQTPIIRVQGGDLGAGRVTVGRALVRYFQKHGRSVLLVDGDVEQPCALCPALEGGPGLVDFLTHPTDIRGLLTIDSVSGAPLLASGRRVALDVASLTLAPLSALIPALQQQFERIVWLDAPLRHDQLQLADALPPHDLIAVYKSGERTIYEVERLMKRGEQSRGQFGLKGVVVNRVRAVDDLLSFRGVWDICLYPLRTLSCLLRR